MGAVGVSGIHTSYEFETILEGFRCIVLAMGLRGVGEGRSKKEAKMGAAEELLEMVGGWKLRTMR